MHWSGLGIILLVAVFVGSIRLTESVPAEKYPGYADYQSTPPMLLPTPLSFAAR